MSKKSVAEVFADYRKRLLNFIHSRINRIEDAEDILQDVFYQFARMNDKINPIENTTAWLFRTASNRIINHYKKKKNEPLPVYYDEDDDDYIFDEIVDIIYAEETTPETNMLRSLVF
jgi:RNA polymerase sigma factor (sigma-70 family)